jgi:hypothetical protein
MKKSIKIIYEDWSLSAASALATGNVFSSKIKEATVYFDGNNTRYIDSISYADNFDCFVHDAFSYGFVYITDRKAVSILQIKCFEFNDSTEDDKSSTLCNNEDCRPLVSNNNNCNANKRKTRKNRPLPENGSIVKTILPTME